MSRIQFVWLEITEKCQLECVHCYADSGPNRDHGAMTVDDWERLVDEIASLGARMVQFIGGEPTLHPDLPRLVDRALGRGLEVEVFTNLVHVTPALWETFTRPAVRLATSWYSDDPAEHAAITRRPTHGRTLANISEAIRRSVPLRVGIIDMGEGQHAVEAREMLTEMGVTDVRIDRLRQVGRGIRDRDASAAELCGNCGDGVAAVGPDGSVWPCVFSRWLSCGTVRENSLAEILRGPDMETTLSELRATMPQMPCVPRMCNPQCGPSCSPSCNPTGTCRPRGGCVPDYR